MQYERFKMKSQQTLINHIRLTIIAMWSYQEEFHSSWLLITQVLLSIQIDVYVCYPII